MNEVVEQNLKKSKLKLKTQEKQLQVIKGLINRSSGYAKTQAQATEKRLAEEIATIKQDIKGFEGDLKKKKTK